MSMRRTASAKLLARHNDMRSRFIKTMPRIQLSSSLTMAGKRKVNANVAQSSDPFGAIVGGPGDGNPIDHIIGYRAFRHSRVDPRATAPVAQRMSLGDDIIRGSLGRFRFRFSEVALGDELGKQAAGCPQLPEGAALDDAALVEHEDQIGIGHG